MAEFLEPLLLLWNNLWPTLLGMLVLAFPFFIYIVLTSLYGNARVLAPIFIGIYVGLLFALSDYFFKLL